MDVGRWMDAWMDVDGCGVELIPWTIIVLVLVIDLYSIYNADQVRPSATGTTRCSS
jgi:hypothetical protein